MKTINAEKAKELRKAGKATVIGSMSDMDNISGALLRVVSDLHKTVASLTEVMSKGLQMHSLKLPEPKVTIAPATVNVKVPEIVIPDYNVPDIKIEVNPTPVNISPEIKMDSSNKWIHTIERDNQGKAFKITSERVG
jgi:hypothetical protein